MTILLLGIGVLLIPISVILLIFGYFYHSEDIRLLRIILDAKIELNAKYKAQMENVERAIAITSREVHLLAGSERLYYKCDHKTAFELKRILSPRGFFEENCNHERLEIEEVNKAFILEDGVEIYATIHKAKCHLCGYEKNIVTKNKD